MIVIQLGPSGYFKIAPRVLGLSETETEQLERGELSRERFGSVLVCVRECMYHLSARPTCGSC